MTPAPRSGCAPIRARSTLRLGRRRAMRRSTLRSARTAAACDRFPPMSLLALTAAEEGARVVLMMLAVGGVFLAVIALGEITHWLRHRR
jgi:hypothetical protein